MLNSNAVLLGVVAVAAGFALSHYSSAANAATRAKPRPGAKPTAGPSTPPSPPTLREKYAAALDAALSQPLLCVCTDEVRPGRVGLVKGRVTDTFPSAHCGLSSFNSNGGGGGWARCDSFILLNRPRRPTPAVEW